MVPVHLGHPADVLEFLLKGSPLIQHKPLADISGENGAASCVPSTQLDCFGSAEGLPEAVEKHKRIARKRARRVGAASDRGHGVLNHVASPGELVVGHEQRSGAGNSFEDGNRAALFDGAQTELKALREAPWYALPSWMGHAEQLFGNAENEIAVGSELNERLDGHAVAFVEAAASQAKASERTQGVHGDIMQAVAACGSSCAATV